jgi:HAD superfamily hydrolase (TIGR01450 family)
MKRLENANCFLLDLDGTVYFSNGKKTELIKGAASATLQLQKRGRVIFLTNNSSKSAAAYYQKLAALGLSLFPDDVYTSGQSAADFLREFYPNKKVFLLGTRELKEEFLAAGIKLCRKNPDVVVTSFDKTLTYARLEKACRFIAGGAVYVATHIDRMCPTFGGFIPDIGCITAYIKEATGLLPSFTCGKPSAIMAENIKKRFGAEGKRTVMIGDRLHTDISFAKNNGFCSALVLSGETKENDVPRSEIKPDYIFDSLAELAMICRKADKQ